MTLATYFFDETGKVVASEDGILPLPLVEGMQITIHGLEGTVFEVESWDYHHGHPDERGGLRVRLRTRRT